MNDDCDNIQSLEDEIQELEEKYTTKSPFELILEISQRKIRDLQRETDAGDIQWEDERPHSETVLFSAVQEHDEMIISKLETGESQLVLTDVDDLNQSIGVFFI